jgi:hypothetical protein
MLFGEGCRGTVRLEAPPHSAQPPQHRHPAQAGRVVQNTAAAAVPDREHPAAGTAMLKLIRLHRQHQPPPVVDFHFKHMHAGNIEHRIGPSAPAHTRTTHTVDHRRGLCQRAWSLLILKAPTPSTHDQHANRALLTHAHLRRPAKQTGLGRFPSREFAINAVWLQLALTAADLIAWTQTILLDAALAKAEPKLLRYRLLHTAARIVRRGRRTFVKIAAGWPWADQLAAAFTRLAGIRQPLLA